MDSITAETAAKIRKSSSESLRAKLQQHPEVLQISLEREEELSCTELMQAVAELIVRVEQSAGNEGVTFLPSPSEGEESDPVQCGKSEVKLEPPPAQQNAFLEQITTLQLL